MLQYMDAVTENNREQCGWPCTDKNESTVIVVDTE